MIARAVTLVHVTSPCIVCGGRDRRVVATARELEAQRRYLQLFHRRRLRVRDAGSMEERADFTQDGAATIAVCKGCGLLLREPEPEPAEMARRYARDTYGAERLEALFASQLELFRGKAGDVAALVTAERPVVLEIGSFVGGFLAASRERGWDAVGIDPGREVASFCRDRGLRVLEENVADCEFPSGTADVIAIWNTFDQLPDPHPALRAIARCLKSDGIVVVRVPNGCCFEACLRRLPRLPRALGKVLLAALAWNNLLAFPYIHGFSTAPLDRLLGGHGFERFHVRGDVLPRLSDRQTKSWAAWEEKILKSAWLMSARILKGGAPDSFPWMDVYFRRKVRKSALAK